MNTTNLFVELIVIGLGAFAWLSLVALTIFGVDLELLRTLAGMPALAVPVLGLVYLLGIITDRLADAAFGALRVERKHRASYEGGSAQFYKDRALVLAQSDQFARLYEYSRSRQRICRGWTLNAIVLLLCLCLFTPIRLSAWVEVRAVLPVICAFLAALAFCCWWTWEAMIDTELRRVHEQAALLTRLQPPAVDRP